MPFTVFGSPDGSDSGAVGEESRGEVWAPLWSEDFTLPEIRQLFAEARASWRGRPARRAADFYAATRTLGIARGVNAFTRFGLQRRNGLAFAAVPLDRIDVRERASVRLVAEVEDWASRFSGTDSSAAVGEAARRFQKAHLEFTRDGDPGRLALLLAELTSLELAVGRSGRARQNAPVPYAPPASRFLEELARDESPELRIAVGLASCASLGEHGAYRFLRHLLLPVDPNGQVASLPGHPRTAVRGHCHRCSPRCWPGAAAPRRTSPERGSSAVSRPSGGGFAFPQTICTSSRPASLTARSSSCCCELAWRSTGGTRAASGPRSIPGSRSPRWASCSHWPTASRRERVCGVTRSCRPCAEPARSQNWP